MAEPELTRDHLQAFLEIAERRSIQAAARASGRSRATYGRLLAELEAAFGDIALIDRAPGRRSGLLTPAGELLARRARLLLRHLDQWRIDTRDALRESARAVRVGALPGTLDLISDILAELRAADPDLPLQIIEYTDDTLTRGVLDGEVDIGFGTLDPGDLPPRLRVHAIGPLPWVLIVPARESARWPARVDLAALDGVPLVVTRTGAAREALERQFADHLERPLHLRAAVEVGSTPRVVEAVDRGFGLAVVSSFRAGFLPPGVEVRELEGGPSPLTAGAFTRRGDPVAGPLAELLARARARFDDLTQRAAARGKRR